MGAPDRRRRSRSGRVLDALIWGAALGAMSGAVPPRAKRAHPSRQADCLQKYARPGVDAVAEFTADHAPAH